MHVSAVVTLSICMQNKNIKRDLRIDLLKLPHVSAMVTLYFSTYAKQQCQKGPINRPIKE